MAAQKRGLNRTTSSQDIAAFSLFIHFLKDIKNIIIEPDKTSADNVIHTTSNKIIANQHKSIQNRSNINMPANGTKKIEEAVSEMLKKHSAGDQILINASILVASTNGMFNNGDVVISPGEIVSLPVTNKSQKIIGMSVHFDKNDVLDWATKKIGNRNTELVNHLLDIFDVIFERFCELRNEENEIVVSKEVFIKTFFMIALSRSVFDNSSVIKKLTFDLFIKDDVDNKVYNEIERNIMDIGLGKITKEQIAFNFLNENDKPEFFVHFKKMVVSISDIFLDLKEALNGN